MKRSRRFAPAPVASEDPAVIAQQITRYLRSALQAIDALAADLADPPRQPTAASLQLHLKGI